MMGDSVGINGAVADSRAEGKKTKAALTRRLCVEMMVVSAKT